MISYATYKVIHIFGILLLIFSLGGLCLYFVFNGSTRAPSAGRKLVAITHGIGLLIVLVGGFGLLARLGIDPGSSWPIWVWLKFGIWILFGGMTMLISKKPTLARPLWLGIPVLGAIAGYLAIHKPF